MVYQTHNHVLFAKWKKRQYVTYSIIALIDIWYQVQTFFTDCLHFVQLIAHSAIFGFHNIDNDTFLIQNHISILLKLHIDSARKYKFSKRN